MAIKFGLYAVQAAADAPGRGATADVERSYLIFIIDSYLGALRVTEFAAGTLTGTNSIPVPIDPQNRTCSSPGLGPTVPRAVTNEVKSLVLAASIHCLFACELQHDDPHRYCECIASFENMTNQCAEKI